MALDEDGPCWLADLHERAVEQVHRSMIARGWEADPDACVGIDAPAAFGEFIHPFGDGFLGRLQFGPTQIFVGVVREGQMIRPPNFRMSVEAGLTYEPADRVLRSLRTGVDTLCAVDAAELIGSDRAWTAEFSDLDDVDRAVADLMTEVVDAHAIGFLQESANIDGFIAMHRRFSAPERDRLVVPAVLGAAGRHREASDRLELPGPSVASASALPSYHDLSAQLRGWLGSGALVPHESDLPPRSVFRMPPPDLASYEPLELRDPSERRREMRAERDSVQRLRRSAVGLTRDEQRAMLVAGLAAQGIEKDPIWVEQLLDAIGRTDAQNFRDLGSVLFGAARLAGTLLKGRLAEAEDGKTDEPDWMVAPSNTWHRAIHDSSQRTLVDLDPDVEAFLDRVWQTRLITRVSKLSDLEVWLAWDPAPRTDASALGVHIGAQRVGTVPRSVVSRYEPLVDATQTIGDWPSISDADLARLTSGAYLLQIPLPAQVSCP